MEKELLSEIKVLKSAIAVVIGTADLPAKERFSQEALNKAAKAFQKLLIERGEWIEEHNLDRYIKHAHHRVGPFIRQEFGFSSFFKRGRTYFYNKKDLTALAKELKDRNVDLVRYMEHKADQATLKKQPEPGTNSKGGRRRKAFQLPYDLKDITTSAAKAPAPEIIKADLNQLKEEFFQYHLSDYIDIYKGNHAIMKYVYYFEKYLAPDLKKRCKRWCEAFNYANHALELITKKRDVFVPVKEVDQIEL